MMHILLAGMLFAAAPAAAPVSGVMSAIQGAVQANNTPAAQVGVVRNGKLIVNAALGMANLDRQVAATAQTQFEIGSITKQFTAAAVLQLAERGKLKLSDPLGKYVPEYARGKNVTLEQLLWQVSGIPNYTDVNHFVHIAGTTPGGVDAAIALIAKKPLDFKPGTRFEYSNTNYLLLGAVVARVSHMTWRQYVRTHIFAPAGMTHSGFIRDEAHLANVATGYQKNKKGNYLPAPPLHGGWAGSAGGIVSTVSDMAKWDEAFFAGKVVRQGDVRLATTPHRLPNGHSTGYGFGWFIDKSDGLTRIEHDGGTFGFASQNSYYPKLHEFLIVLTNDAGPDPQFIAAKAFDALHPQLAAANFKPAKGEDPAVTALARQWLHRAQTGDIDKSQLTQKFARDLTSQVVTAVKGALAPLGDPSAFVYTGKTPNGTATEYDYRVKFKSAIVKFSIIINRKGKIAGLDFEPD